MSSVAPRGIPAAGSGEIVDLVMVSEELFRFKDSFTVAALPEDTTLA